MITVKEGQLRKEGDKLREKERQGEGEKKIGSKRKEFWIKDKEGQDELVRVKII